MHLVCLFILIRLSSSLRLDLAAQYWSERVVCFGWLEKIAWVWWFCSVGWFDWLEKVFCVCLDGFVWLFGFDWLEEDCCV